MFLILMEYGMAFAKVEECLDGTSKAAWGWEKSSGAGTRRPGSSAATSLCDHEQVTHEVGPSFRFHQVLETTFHLIFAQISPPSFQSNFTIHHACSSPTS